MREVPRPVAAGLAILAVFLFVVDAKVFDNGLDGRYDHPLAWLTASVVVQCACATFGLRYKLTVPSGVQISGVSFAGVAIIVAACLTLVAWVVVTSALSGISFGGG